MDEPGVIRLAFPARVKSRGSPSSFTGTARFVVQQPKEANEIAEHDRGWMQFIDRQIARAPRPPVRTTTQGQIP